MSKLETAQAEVTASNQQNATLDLKNRYLTFFLDEEQYGIHISNIKEIIALIKTTKIPKMPDYMKGVMNLRGNIIPVIDMRLKFDLAEKEPEMHTAIVIIQVKEINIGFIVDRVEEVLPISAEQISEPPKFGTKINTNFIKGMGQVNNNVIMLLDLDSLLSEKDMESMDNVNI